MMDLSETLGVADPAYQVQRRALLQFLQIRETQRGRKLSQTDTIIRQRTWLK